MTGIEFFNFTWQPDAFQVTVRPRYEPYHVMPYIYAFLYSLNQNNNVGNNEVTTNHEKAFIHINISFLIIQL